MSRRVTPSSSRTGTGMLQKKALIVIARIDAFVRRILVAFGSNAVDFVKNICDGFITA